MERPDNNPKSAFGVRKVPLHLIPPAALVHLAKALQQGAEKYGAFNWRDKDVAISVYISAALRHLMACWDGEDVDPESGQYHLAHAMACLAIVLDADSLGKMVDDRPRAGAAPEMLRALVEQEYQGPTMQWTETPKDGGCPACGQPISDHIHGAGGVFFCPSDRPKGPPPVPGETKKMVGDWCLSCAHLHNLDYLCRGCDVEGKRLFDVPGDIPVTKPSK